MMSGSQSMPRPNAGYRSAIGEVVPVPILMYHSVSWHAAPRFGPYNVTPAEFASQMTYLAEHGYTTLGVSQFVHARNGGRSKLPERPVVLTFDDGFADFHEHALPILRRRGFAATVYVVTGYVGDTSRWLELDGEANRLMLTWDQLAEMCIAGIEIGAHSHTHPQLDILQEALAGDEITRSKRLLEEHLGQSIDSFAYPFGYYTAGLQRIVREAGFTSACAGKFVMSSTRDDRFALSRLMVRPEIGLEAFGALLTNMNWFVPPAVGRLLAWGWRLRRRSAGYRQRSGLEAE